MIKLLPKLLVSLVVAFPVLTKDAAGNGSLLIAGGALKANNQEVYEAFINGLLAEGPVVIIPAASASPVSSGETMQQAFAQHGVAPERLV
ncbi:MAG: cyanophycinase, partial [Pseudomonadota bacterium]